MNISNRNKSFKNFRAELNNALVGIANDFKDSVSYMDFVSACIDCVDDVYTGKMTEGKESDLYKSIFESFLLIKKNYPTITKGMYKSSTHKLSESSIKNILSDSCKVVNEDVENPVNDNVVSSEVYVDTTETSSEIVDSIDVGNSSLITETITQSLSMADFMNGVVATLKEQSASEDVLNILMDVVNDEHLIIGKLQKALELVNPVAGAIDTGKSQAENTIQESKKSSKGNLINESSDLSKLAADMFNADNTLDSEEYDNILADLSSGDANKIQYYIDYFSDWLDDVTEESSDYSKFNSIVQRLKSLIPVKENINRGRHIMRDRKMSRVNESKKLLKNRRTNESLFKEFPEEDLKVVATQSHAAAINSSRKQAKMANKVMSELAESNKDMYVDDNAKHVYDMLTKKSNNKPVTESKRLRRTKRFTEGVYDVKLSKQEENEIKDELSRMIQNGLTSAEAWDEATKYLVMSELKRLGYKFDVSGNDRNGRFSYHIEWWKPEKNESIRRTSPKKFMNEHSNREKCIPRRCIMNESAEEEQAENEILVAAEESGENISQSDLKQKGRELAKLRKQKKDLTAKDYLKAKSDK